MSDTAIEGPLNAQEKADMLLRAQRGELTPEDCMRFIAATRGSFLANAAKAGTNKKAVPVTESVDFF